MGSIEEAKLIATPYETRTPIESAEPVRRRRLLEGGTGTRSEAFGPIEWALLAGIGLIWGSSFFLIDIALEAFRPGVITAGRVILGAAALSLLPAARRPIEREDLPRAAFLGVIWIGIPLSLFPIAQLWIDSSVAGMLNGAMPLATAAWSALLFRRAPAQVQVAGLVLGFVGVVAISWAQLQGSEATLLGTVLVLGAITLYGLAANIAVPLQQRYGALPVLLRSQLAALVIVIPFGLFHLPGSHWSAQAALAVVPLGALGTGLAFALMATLVGRVGGPRGSVAIYFVPLVAMALGALVLDEAIARSAMAGTALVITGAWLTSRRDRSQSNGVPQAASR